MHVCCNSLFKLLIIIRILFVNINATFTPWSQIVLVEFLRTQWKISNLINNYAGTFNLLKLSRPSSRFSNTCLSRLLFGLREQPACRSQRFERKNKTVGIFTTLPVRDGSPQSYVGVFQFFLYVLRERNQRLSSQEYSIERLDIVGQKIVHQQDAKNTTYPLCTSTTHRHCSLSCLQYIDSLFSLCPSHFSFLHYTNDEQLRQWWTGERSILTRI